MPGIHLNDTKFRTHGIHGILDVAPGWFRNLKAKKMKLRHSSSRCCFASVVSVCLRLSLMFLICCLSLSLSLLLWFFLSLLWWWWVATTEQLCGYIWFFVYEKSISNKTNHHCRRHPDHHHHNNNYYILHYLSGEGCQASCSQELASEVPSKAHNTYSKQYILAILTIMIVDAATPRFGAMIADQLLQEVAKHAAKGTRPRFPSAEWSWERIVSNLEVLTAWDLNSSFTSRTCIEVLTANS